MFVLDISTLLTRHTKPGNVVAHSVYQAPLN